MVCSGLYHQASLGVPRFFTSPARAGADSNSYWQPRRALDGDGIVQRPPGEFRKPLAWYYRMQRTEVTHWPRQMTSGNSMVYIEVFSLFDSFFSLPTLHPPPFALRSSLTPRYQVAIGSCRPLPLPFHLSLLSKGIYGSLSNTSLEAQANISHQKLSP